jgi:hypothetical protein
MSSAISRLLIGETAVEGLRELIEAKDLRIRLFKKYLSHTYI